MMLLWCGGGGVAGTQLLFDVSGVSGVIAWCCHLEEVTLKLKTLQHLLSVRGRENCSKHSGRPGPMCVDFRRPSWCLRQIARGFLTLQ